MILVSDIADYFGLYDLSNCDNIVENNKNRNESNNAILWGRG
jgi:hypothetical protein